MTTIQTLIEITKLEEENRRKILEDKLKQQKCYGNIEVIVRSSN